MTPEPLVGVLGGTFDPVHLGHVQIVDQVRRAVRMSRWLLLLSGLPPHKDPAELTPACHREAMLRLALGERDDLELCLLEVGHRNVCYTIDSLRALGSGPPRSRPVFILGMDALLEIPTWREWRALIDEFDMIVVDRPGKGLAAVAERVHPDVARRLTALPSCDSGNSPTGGPGVGRGGRIFHLPIPEIPVSSSAVRARAAAGLGLAGLVHPAVAGYIQTHHLYRQEGKR